MKRLVLAVVVLALSACENPAETEKTAPEKAERPVLELPPYPELPTPISKLAKTDKGKIYFSTRSPYDFTRVLKDYDQVPDMTGMGTLVLPEGASSESPVPAMIILHGSGGIKEGREFTYAELFAKNGIASLVVDYYWPRGVNPQTPYVMKTMAATEVDIIADAYSALNVLGTHPAIDASRIGVTGYSYGGMATRYTLDKRLKNIMAPDVPPFALHMDIYGPCHQNTGSWETTGAPYLAIHGDADNSVDPAKCEEVQENLRDGGSSVETLVIEGAGHAWENTDPISEFGGAYIRGCEFSWHPETGVFLVDGHAGKFQPEPDMTRPERAAVRAGLGELAGGCIGKGYIVGSNPAADNKSKTMQLQFMRRGFNLSPFQTTDRWKKIFRVSSQDEITDFMDQVREAAKSRDPIALAEHFHFPLNVTGNLTGESKRSISKSEFISNFEEIFGADVLAKLESVKPEEFWYNWRGGSIANGAAWYARIQGDIRIFEINR